MHILIADDETPARGELRYILEYLAPEAMFYEAANGRTALALIEREPIEVAFLDINMPDLDGLAVAATIMDCPEPPLIVFATAYNEHAVRAFELAALDYVVKPFDERRLGQTMVRIRQALAERVTLEQRQAALRGYLLSVAPAGGLIANLCCLDPTAALFRLTGATFLFSLLKIPIMQLSAIPPALDILATLVSLVAVYLLVCYVIRPLQRLNHMAGQVAWGNFAATEEPAGSVQEIRDLHVTLKQMAAQIQRYQAGMRERALLVGGYLSIDSATSIQSKQ